MNTKKNKKSGFTLVELMVVAIIVAILAAVAIPLMTGQSNRAMATEGQTGCGAVATALRMLYVQDGGFGTMTNGSSAIGLPGLAVGALNGTYFNDGSYDLTALTDGDDYTITATGKADGKAAGKTVIMTVTSGSTEWSGTLK